MKNGWIQVNQRKALAHTMPDVGARAWLHVEGVNNIPSNPFEISKGDFDYAGRAVWSHFYDFTHSFSFFLSK